MSIPYRTIHQKFETQNINVYFQVEPVLPYEFTMEGYLERINYYLKYQDFCQPNEDIELTKSLIVKKSKSGQDCIETCDQEGMNYFGDVS